MNGGASVGAGAVVRAEVPKNQDVGAYRAVAIAASLGGIGALSRVLADLPPEFPLPILVVQHLRRGQPSFLPAILAWRTARRVEAARDGDRPAPGVVHVAPPDRHLVIRPDGALGLSRSEPVNFCRPSADVLFRSLAETFGPRAIAVVLTGMGRDGARGVEAVARAEGATIAQDEASAEAPGMPRAAVDIGRADLVLPLDRIGFALTVLAGGGKRRTRARHGPARYRALPTAVSKHTGPERTLKPATGPCWFRDVPRGRIGTLARQARDAGPEVSG